jgi:hypothetical protein
MTHRTLREIAKFLSGAVAAKLATVFWLSANGLLPIVLAGTPFTDQSIFPAMIFNIALLAILIYYGWHLKSPVHAPSEKKLLYGAGIVFLIVAVIHFLRLMTGWALIVGSLVVPLWLSWFGVALALYLSYASFHFALRMRGAK